MLLSYTAFSQTISSNAPFCGNQNLTLELAATGGSTYAWKGPNGFASTQQKPTLKNVNWKNRGVYTVLVDNKTTLTTDVNIKDPVAFTVPKEISVNRASSVLFEPKNNRLTDSTEIPNSYSFITPKGVLMSNNAVRSCLEGDEGTYKIIGNSSSSGCSVTQTVKVSISNKSLGDKFIEMGSLLDIKICYGQDYSIPFYPSPKSYFNEKIKYKVYLLKRGELSPTSRQPDAIVDKSPVTLKGIGENSINYYERILIIADDTEKTAVISDYGQFPDPHYNGVYYQNTINSTTTCDTAKLTINSSSILNSFQWFQDGKVILGANTPNFIAKSSGIYTVKFKGNYEQTEINKTCLYESQPVKIELGKIEKPSAYVNNDIELCVGKPATLTVSTKLNTNYRWKKDGVFIANATKATFETLQEGKYQIEAKEGTCTAVSDTVVLRKPEKLDAFAYISQDVPIEYTNNVVKLCNNQPFSLKGGINYNNKTYDGNFQWFRNNVLIKDSTRNELKNLLVDGTYILKAQYGQCSSNSSSEQIIKYSKNLLVKTYNINEFCEFSGGTINLNSARVLQFNNATEYQVLKGNIYQDGNIINDWNILDKSRYSTALNVTNSGSYYAIGKILLKNGSECTINTDTTNVKMVKKLKDQQYGFDSNIQAVPITTCSDTSVIKPYARSFPQYNYRDRETSFKWTKDGTIIKQDSSFSLQVTQNGTYQLETTYKGLACSVLFSPYKVEFGKINIGFRNVSASICPNDSYYLFSNHSLLNYDINNNYELYKDGQIFLRNINNPALSNGLIGLITQSGTYKLTVKNGKCEGTSPDFVLKVDKIPTAISPTDSAIFCAGKTVDLKVSTEAGLSYIWERNGSVIGQANQPTLSASTDGLYRATLLRGSCWGSTPIVKLKSLPNIIPTATLTGDQKIDYDKETKLSINLSSYAPWTFKLSDGKEYTATKSPFEIAVKPLSTTTYNLSEVKNICGTGTVSGTAKIEIIILSAEEEMELQVEVFPVPSSEICNWKIQTPAISTASVVLYDVSGITQYTHTPNTRSQSHEGTIDLSTLKAGTYFLKLQAGEKSVTRKVVKF